MMQNIFDQLDFQKNLWTKVIIIMISTEYKFDIMCHQIFFVLIKTKLIVYFSLNFLIFNLISNYIIYVSKIKN